MKTEPLDFEIYGVAHDVAMGYLDDKLFSKINDELSFQEVESLIGQWGDQSGIYRGTLVNPDLAFFMHKGDSDEHAFYFSQIENWTTIGYQDNGNVTENSLKRIEEFTEIKSSRTELCAALRNAPHYPKKPESRYILVCIKSELAFVGAFTLNAAEYNADKVVFTQTNFDTVTRTVLDIIFGPDELKFNFLGMLLYDGETIMIDNTEYEGTPIAFDMWIYDTQTEKKVFTGNFMSDITFGERIGLPFDKPHGFIDSNCEEERCRTHLRQIRSRKK